MIGHSNATVFQISCYAVTPMTDFAIIRALDAPVAQLDRVHAYEAWGRTFESCRARHHSYFAG